jgi:oligosaccharide repeat unit polymerase
MISYFLLIILTLLIIFYFIAFKNKNLFDPLNLFSAYYFLVIPAALYGLITNFEHGEYISNFKNDTIYLFNITIILFIIGYIATIMGYRSFKKNGKIVIKYEDESKISNKVLLIFIIINFLIGVINFTYNIEIISEGDFIDYMKKSSIRPSIDLIIPHTTIFYINTYTSVFLFMYYIRRANKRINLLFFPLLVTFIILASTGRGFSTISYFITIICIHYYLYNGSSNNNYKYLKLLIYIIPLSGLLYLVRMGSSMMISDSDLSSSDIAIFYKDVINIEFIGNILYGKGNLPNIPVVMKIIDSWETDIGYLYGKSLFTWIFNILPADIRLKDYQPSVMIKSMDWYPNALGSHPPTGIGEMYANFGVIGPFIGMYLFGAFCAFLYNMLLRCQNFWVLLIYSQIIIGFILIFPKGEFDNLSLWQVIPTILSYIILRFFTDLFRLNKLKKQG